MALTTMLHWTLLIVAALVAAQDQKHEPRKPGAKHHKSNISTTMQGTEGISTVSISSAASVSWPSPTVTVGRSDAAKYVTVSDLMGVGDWVLTYMPEVLHF